MLVNVQHAYNSKYDQFTHWHPILIPPVYDNYADVIGEALTLAHQSRSERIKSLFYQSMMTFAWANHPEYPELKADVLAATLLIPFDFQKDVIRDIDPELSEAPAYEAAIIERVLAIKDHVIRARALWRVAYYRRYWKKMNLWDLSIQAAEQISTPLHRSRAFERLINYVPHQQRERLKDEALGAARQVSDPNNQARALARLALFESTEKRWSLLAEALMASKSIADEQQQIDTLQLLYPYLIESSRLTQMYDDNVKQIKSDWYRDKGKNILATHLLALHEKLHEAQKLTPVVLASLIDEIVGLKPREAEIEDLWRQLLEPTQRDFAVSALLSIASTNGLDGFYLTQNIFDVIRSLLDTQEIAAIYLLLPYLRNNEVSLLPALNSWVENPPDKMVRAYAGLLLAEMGQVDSLTIPCLVELITDGIDFGRYRASIVLHGSDTSYTKKKRDFRISQLGEKALLFVAQAQKNVTAEKVQIRAPLGWFWSNLLYDDPLLFQQLVRVANTDEGLENGSSGALKAISYCDNDTLDALVNQFENGSEKTQEMLLSSWVELSSHHFDKYITQGQKQRVEAAIAMLPDSILDNFKYIPERKSTILKIITSTGEKIVEKQITLQKAVSVMNQALDALAHRLTDAPIEVHAPYFGYRFNDAQMTLDAANTLSENGTALELLFMWLAASLRENIDDFPPDYYRTSTLLELASATTRFSPAAVYNLCERNELGPLLVQATMHHASFWGRAGAAVLLGYLRQTPELFDEAILSGLQDVATVQKAIVQMVQNLRYLDESMIPKMMELLGHEHASVVYATSKLLASVARNEKIRLSLRQEIVRILNITIQRKDSSRPVFTLEEENEYVHINSLGRLDQQLYGVIIDIIGIE
jgi:hypothetical protein